MSGDGVNDVDIIAGFLSQMDGQALVALKDKNRNPHHVIIKIKGGAAAST